MKKLKYIIPIVIILLFFIIFSHNNKKSNLDDTKSAKEVMRTYINAMNSKDIDIMKKCIYSNKEYNSEYTSFGITSKERLDNIEHIEYIDSEEVPFRETEGAFKNGKIIKFKEGKRLDVTYNVKYKIENEPEESGKNDFMYSLVKDKEGNYKIIESGY